MDGEALPGSVAPRAERASLAKLLERPQLNGVLELRLVEGRGRSWEASGRPVEGQWKASGRPGGKVMEGRGSPQLDGVLELRLVNAHRAEQSV